MTAPDENRWDDGPAPDVGTVDASSPDTSAVDSPPAVAVVGAETPGNVGTVARAMKNFGFTDLLLVDPPDLDPDGEAYGFAGHAREDVLPTARELSFDALVREYHTVGFTAITGETPATPVRYPFRTPSELAESLRTVSAPTALVFGRERIGLTNAELARIDEVCSIPANPAYPVLNLGQAATVACYELRGLALDDDQHPEGVHERAPEAELEAFYDHLAETLATLGVPVEKRPKTLRLLRRLFGRAHPTGREVNTLRGLLRRTTRPVDRDDSDAERPLDSVADGVERDDTG